MGKRSNRAGLKLVSRSSTPATASGRSCATCNAYEPMVPGQGLCRADPPQIMVTSPPGVPEAQRSWFSAPPPVVATGWCRRWEGLLTPPAGTT